MNQLATGCRAVMQAGRRQRIRKWLRQAAWTRIGHMIQITAIFIYYSVLIVGLLLVLFETWCTGSFPRGCAVLDCFKHPLFAAPAFRSTVYVMIGGALGAMLYCIRMLIYYYADKRTYDSRWFGKYLTAPLEGATLGFIVYVVLRGGLASIGGLPLTADSPVNNYAVLGLGALIGFGLRYVVRWLINVAQTIFCTKDNGKTGGKGS